MADIWGSWWDSSTQGENRRKEKSKVNFFLLSFSPCFGAFRVISKN
jgi:hypothetical protein